MKKWIWAGLLLVLTGCSQEGLTIEPVELEEEEQALINKTAMETFHLYEVDGTIPEGADLVIKAEHYVNGEPANDLFAVGAFLEETLDEALFSFGKSTVIGGAEAFVIGTPSGKSESYTETESDGMQATWGGLLTGETELELEKPLYTAYYAKESGNGIRSGNYLTPAGELNLEGIREFEHFYVMSMTLTEEGLE
ncbi:hypothetical protein [Indiicoccus explosivorum]|uniref:hypothetical protein n=1 Tax=Indiicoccus explosivorum TaxID=1917864 RepID=UPI000B44595C|nr:hypothetical protein [Indiicoccus explosivorum]